MHFPRHPLGDPRRRAARDRQGVDVAEQRKGDALAIGADIDVDPGAFIGVDLRLFQRRALRCVDVPFGLFGGLVLRVSLTEHEKRGEDAGDRLTHMGLPDYVLGAIGNGRNRTRHPRFVENQRFSRKTACSARKFAAAELVS